MLEYPVMVKEDEVIGSKFTISHLIYMFISLYHTIELYFYFKIIINPLVI